VARQGRKEWPSVKLYAGLLLAEDATISSAPCIRPKAKGYANDRAR
jgi:hypothetical protein